MSKVVAIQGLQFGSEGKGQIAGMVGHVWAPETVVCANHPNAGHTYHDPLGRRFIHRVLPVSAVCPGVKHICVGPGAVVDLTQLMKELSLMDSCGALKGKKVHIHPNAAILLPQHVKDEEKLVRIGSTMKGSMEAIIHKMRREDNTSNIATRCTFAIEAMLNYEEVIDFDQYEYEDAISAPKVLAEGAQGFSLGIHERFYPYCTSRDVSTAQLLADCRIPVPYGHDLHVIGVARTFPIRVANRFDENGNQIGTSGPGYPDQSELTWDQVGRKAELTTVTRLPRRVFTFSQMQVKDAVRVMRADTIALTFCDYLYSTQEAIEEGDGPVISIPGHTHEFAMALEENMNVPVRLLSFGARFEDTRETYNMEDAFDPQLRFLAP